MAFLARRTTGTVRVGGVPVGSGHPVVVQSMTNTDTADAAATATQVAALARAGSELVRVTVNNDESAAAVPEIMRRLADTGVVVPVIGDFHYNGHLLLAKYPDCARALAKYRINPGNVGGQHRDENFRTIVQVAIDHGKPVRIGVNWGSLDQDLLTQMMDANARRPEPREAKEVYIEAMIESALRSARARRRDGTRARPHHHLGEGLAGAGSLDVYRRLAARCDYPLHLGLTEAGLGMKGIVATTAGLSIVLGEGIGDTIRVSLTPSPGGDRTEEVLRRAADPAVARTAQLHATGHRMPGVRPHDEHVLPANGGGHPEDICASRCPSWRDRHPGVEEMRVAVMGCVVNGPGESKHANIGISLPGTAEDPKAPVYVDGQLARHAQGR